MSGWGNSKKIHFCFKPENRKILFLIFTQFKLQKYNRQPTYELKIIYVHYSLAVIPNKSEFVR